MSKYREKDMDMVHGPLFRNMIVYSIPLVLSGFLQLLFNAADMAVVGKFTGSHALAAVSAASPFSSLIVTLFLGLSTGVNVLLAQALGSENHELFHKGLHTAIASSLVIGLLLMGAGLFFSAPVMKLIHTPKTVLSLSLVYLRIYMLGIPAMMLYNFGSAVLRACGDTRRPFQYMAIAGILNVCLNLFFVICFHLGTAGVAIATVISESVSAFLVLHTLTDTDQIWHLKRKDLKIDPVVLKQILWIGIPAGLQGAAFSIANLLIQSAINSFGPVVMAASAIVMNADSFCYVGVDAIGQTSLTFISQNYGAGNMKRIQKIFRFTMIIGVSLEISLGLLCYFAYRPFMSLFTSSENVIRYGREIMFPICVFGFVNATMNVPFHAVRGMGHSVFPMLCTIICVCFLRILWVYMVFPHIPTIGGLYAAWPVTKGIASFVAIIYYFHVIHTMTGKL